MPDRYFMPAEWEPHEATWIAWPHNRRDWPGKMGPIPWVFGEMVRKLVPGEIVRIIVQDANHEAAATRVLRRAAVDLGRVEFVRIATNRGWTRDMGPIFVRRGSRRGPLMVADFAFNAWAKYPDYRDDNRVAARAAKKLGVPSVRPMVRDKPLVLEGGAIDVNGRGTLLTTEQCLLDNTQQARNPHLSQAELEAALKTWLGLTNIFYLGEGIAGDDTGGHIDDLCRFVNASTVVVVSESNAKDENYRPLCDARERLEGFRLEDGGRAEVVSLPSPAPLMFDGVRLPASYVNFYIGNEAVLVPTFNDPADRTALGILSELFPRRDVVGIHAADLVWGFGTVHCLTQQQPAVKGQGSGA
ncbi:MAG: agmatine deiminase family protein [Planctomycetota bacterium]